MKIIMTNSFKKANKKLTRKQITLVEDIIEEIEKDPKIGESKTGDLAGVRVHKFYLDKKMMLLAYQYSKKELVLLSLNGHENFYRDLKKRL